MENVNEINKDYRPKTTFWTLMYVRCAVKDQNTLFFHFLNWYRRIGVPNYSWNSPGCRECDVSVDISAAATTQPMRGGWEAVIGQDGGIWRVLAISTNDASPHVGEKE